jgi:hypothetical protein
MSSFGVAFFWAIASKGSVCRINSKPKTQNEWDIFIDCVFFLKIKLKIETVGCVGKKQARCKRVLFRAVKVQQRPYMKKRKPFSLPCTRPFYRHFLRFQGSSPTPNKEYFKVQRILPLIFYGFLLF